MPIHAANPYNTIQAFIAGGLIPVVILWVRAKPPAHPVLRVPAAAAALVTVLAVLASLSGFMDDVLPACRLALQSSLLLGGCLIAELLSPRGRVPEAFASWRTRDLRAPSTQVMASESHDLASAPRR